MQMRRMTAPDRPSGSRWTLLRRAAGLFRPHRSALLLMVVLLAVTSAMQLLSVRVMGAMVDEMVSGTAGALNWLVLLAAGLVLGSALVGVAQSYLNQVIGQGVMLRLRSDLHGHLQRLPVRFFTLTRTGEILSRVSTDVNAVQQAVTGTFTEFLQAALTLMGEKNHPGIMQTSAEHLITILGNIESNPAEKKYRKLKLTNRMVAEKVMPAKGAKPLLLAVGFAQVRAQVRRCPAILLTGRQQPVARAELAVSVSRCVCWSRRRATRCSSCRAVMSTPTFSASPSTGYSGCSRKRQTGATCSSAVSLLACRMSMTTSGRICRTGRLQSVLRWSQKTANYLPR